jgi:colicin import membrane protein
MSTLLLNPRQMYAPDPEQQPVAAGVLTAGVHLMFAAVLFLNMSWQQNIRPQGSVKLWKSMPTNSVKVKRSSKPKPVAPAKPEIEPVPKQVVETFSQPEPALVAPAVPPPPSPVVDVPQPVTPEIAPPRADLAAPTRERVDKPAPDGINKVAVEPPPTPTPTQFEEQPDRKPEVDVDALRRERALALAKQLREEESARLDETLDRERTERNEENRKRLEERERKLARELQEISAAAQQRRTELKSRQAQDAAARGVADDYRARISAKIRQRVILPPDLKGNPEAIYEVSLLPGGEVTQVRLLQSSGTLTYDAAVERAILAAQPLPVPEDPGLFHANFKNFLLSFRPKE